MKRIIKGINKRITQAFFPEKTATVIDTEAPFGTSPRADRDTYLSLYVEACARKHPEMERYLENSPFMIDRDWLESLALHTQVVIKYSELNFQHGRLLYAVLRDMMDKRGSLGSISILETGTARGFSTMCMAKALKDAGRCGKIVTLDIIPHNKPIYWNCIDDNEGQKTREQLLSPWREELESVVFIQGDTRSTLGSLGMARIHFAFLDACHSEEDVMFEYNYVAARQSQGDIIVFDDVTNGVFDGVVAAVDRIESQGVYVVERLSVDENRGYAVAKRK